MIQEQQGTSPIIFISYSHKDEEWKDKIIPFFKQLELLELVGLCNDQEIDHGPDWYANIKSVLERTRFAICLISKNYLSSRFCIDEEISYLLQQRAKSDLEIIPILISDCLWQAEPWLRRLQMVPGNGKNLTTDFGNDPDPELVKVARHVYDALQPGYVRPEPAPPAGTPPDKVDITRLPETGELLFGRKKEIRLLDEAWERDDVNIVVLKAGGGVGKSTLTRVWTLFMAEENYLGAKRVFAWSFYSQGTGERVTSADAFIANALEWFGDPDPTVGSPWDKGERLARLVAEHRTLLLLDGMEPLQSHVKQENGAIKDPGLQMLVRDLARHNPGLCVISTRETVGDLMDSRFAGSVVHEDLEHVSLVAGRALMRVRGVHGEDSALEATVERFDRHALAINLLASYLTEFESRDISRVQEFPLPRGEEVTRRAAEGADHPARRVVAAFEQRLQDTPELDLLNILGLFDRPITGGEFEAITAEPPIPGLTDKLLAGTGAGTGLILPVAASLVDRRILERLRKVGLIAPQSHHERNEIDAHPLIREHFAAQLDQHHADAASEAHRRLYEHLKGSAPELPDNLSDMMPLYHAVAHGCKAGLFGQARTDVFRDRILRGHEFFAWRKLGAFGLSLSSLSGFFVSPWSQIENALSNEEASFVLNWAAACLRASGRSRDTAQLMEVGIQSDVTVGKWRNAAIEASNLSQLSLTLGDVSCAVRQGEQGVELADRSGDAFQRMSKRATLATALNAAARGRWSAEAFAEAEGMQKETQPEYPLLYSLWGYDYCDLLLDELAILGDQAFATTSPEGQDRLKHELVQVRSRAEKALQIVLAGSQNLLDIGLNHLMLGRTWLLEAELRISQNSSPESQMDKAEHHLNESVTLLRQAGAQEFIARGLLHRATLWRVKFQIAKDKSHIDLAERDLAEVETIAERGDMLIWQIEAALERTRLYLARARLEGGRVNEEMRDRARGKLEEAKDLVRQTEKPYEPHVPDWEEWDPPEYVGVFKVGEIVGYHCRNDEIDRLQKQIDSLK